MKKLLSLLAVNQAGGVGGDALHAACEAEALGGGGFDGDVALPDAHEGREGALHSGYVGVELWALGADGGVDVAYLPPRVAQEADGAAEEQLAVDACELLGGVGEVVADVAQRGGAEQGVADGVDEDVGVAMAKQAVSVGDEDASEPQLAPFNELVDIVAEACADGKHGRINN